MSKSTKKKSTLVKGQTLQLKISGTSKNVTWSSSKNSVAKVDSKPIAYDYQYADVDKRGI